MAGGHRAEAGEVNKKRKKNESPRHLTFLVGQGLLTTSQRDLYREKHMTTSAKQDPDNGRTGPPDNMT